MRNFIGCPCTADALLRLGGTRPAIGCQWPRVVARTGATYARGFVHHEIAAVTSLPRLMPLVVACQRFYTNCSRAQQRLLVIPRMLDRLDTAAITFVLGSFTAAVGWLVPYVIDNAISVPTLQYDLAYRGDETNCSAGQAHSSSRNENGDYSSNEIHSIIVSLHNISRGHKLTQLEFVLLLKRSADSSFLSFSPEARPIEVVPPAYPSRSPTEQHPNSISYSPIDIYPNMKIILSACYIGNAKPTFHLERSEGVLRLSKRGLTTWLIRNELEVLTGFIATGSFLILVIVVAWLLGNSRNARGSNAN